jgi:hypothetical protein
MPIPSGIGIGVGLNTVMGNPDLDMEETVTYEFGFQQQDSRGCFALDFAVLQGHPQSGGDGQNRGNLFFGNEVFSVCEPQFR